MNSQRTQVVAAIRALQDTLTRAAQQDVALATRLRRGDPDALELATQEACRQAGLSVEAYESAVDREPELRLLEQKAILEGLGGTTDPGPHDAISRESPSGRAGDLSKPRYEDDHERPQMSTR